MQKKIELAQANKADPTEIAKLVAERGKAIDQFKAQADQGLKDTTNRFFEVLGEKNSDLFAISARRLGENMARQTKMREELEAAGLMDFSADEARVQEAVKEVVTAEPKDFELDFREVVQELRPAEVVDRSAEQTELFDEDLRNALILLSTAAVLVGREGGKAGEKSIWDRMLDNLRRLEGSAKKEKGEKATSGIKEALGFSSKDEKEKTQPGITASALDKFIAGMDAEKKGKAQPGFFGKLLANLGRQLFMHKIDLVSVGGIKPGLSKIGDLGAVIVKGRLESVLSGQLGKVDLAKDIPENELDGSRAELREINSRMDAYDAANPGNQDTPERRSMDAEYASARDRFDRLRGISPTVEASQVEQKVDENKKVVEVNTVTAASSGEVPATLTASAAEVAPIEQQPVASITETAPMSQAPSSTETAA